MEGLSPTPSNGPEAVRPIEPEDRPTARGIRPFDVIEIILGTEKRSPFRGPRPVPPVVARVKARPALRFAAHRVLLSAPSHSGRSVQINEIDTKNTESDTKIPLSHVV